MFFRRNHGQDARRGGRNRLFGRDRQVRKKGARRRVRGLETLESRHLLATTVVNPNIAGQLGDVVRIDLPTLLAVDPPAVGHLEYEVDAFSAGSVAQVGGLPLSDGGAFKDVGVLYFLPTIATPSTSQTVDATGTAAASATYRVRYFNAANMFVENSYQGTINLTIGSDYSEVGADSVTQGTDPLDVFKAEQRLRYLGYQNQTGNASTLLAVDGISDAATKHAIGVFNAAIDDMPSVDENSTLVSLCANRADAPRWRQVTFGAGLTDAATDEFLTHQGVEVLNAANANTAQTLTFTAGSTRGGGDTPAHSSHEGGLDIDIDTASTDDGGTPFYKTNTIGGAPFVAAQVAAIDPAANDHIAVLSGINYIAKRFRGAITGATNATPIVITSTGHGLATGDQVSIAGVGGNTNANGTRTVTVINANSFSLNGSMGNAAYTSGGTWTRTTAPAGAVQHVVGASGTDPAATQNNEAVLSGIASLIVSGPGYVLANEQSKIEAFRSQGGGKVARVLYNDPRLWTSDGVPVQFSIGHGGHFHVDVKKIDKATQGSVSGSLGALGGIFGGFLGDVVNVAVDAGGGSPDALGQSPAGSPSIQDLLGPSGLPFISDTLDDMIDIDGVFNDFLRQMVDRAIVTGVDAPMFALNLATDQRLQIVFEGGDPFEITLDAGGYADLNALEAELEDALTDAGLNSMLQAGQNSGNLTIETVDEGVTTNLVVTTLRLEGTGADTNGQLTATNADAVFTIEVERIIDDLGTTATTQHQVTIHDTSPTEAEIEAASPLDVPHANDNVDINDLIEDVNNALLLAEHPVPPDPDHPENPLIDVVAIRKGTSGDFVLVPTAPEIVRIRVTSLSGNETNDLGLANNAQVSESWFPGMAVTTSPLGFIGTRHTPDLIYSDINDLMTQLEGILNEVSDTPLPGAFDVDPVYDPDTDSMLFNFQVNRDFAESVDLDFNEGLDLGPLGRLEILGEATAGISGSFTLDFRAGIYLGGLGADFVFDASTPLVDLNGGNGVPLDVGVTATNIAPANGQVAANVSFNLGVNGVAHAVSLNFNDTTNNFDRPALAEDLNERALHNTPLTAFSVGDLNGDGDADRLDDVLAFSVDNAGTRLALNATHPLINSLSLTNTSNLALLGFTNGQTGNAADLVITDGSGTYNVDLDGALDVGDVETLIEAAAPNVDVTIDGVNKRLVLVTSVGTLAVAQPTEDIDDDPAPDAVILVPTSSAGTALGIIAAPGTDTIEGMPLHGATNEDRIFLVEGGVGDDNVTVELNVDASGLELSAGLGILSFDLAEEPGSPLTFGVELAARLLDPDTTSPDGRITIQEVAEAVTEGRFDDLVDVDPPTFNADGTLELSVPLLQDLTNSPDDFVQFDIGITDPTDITTLTFDVNVNEDALEGLQNLSIEQIVAIVQDLVNELAQNDTIPWLNEKIPLVDKSLADLIGYLDDLLDKINEIASAIDSGALEEKLQDIESAIGNVDLPFASPAKQSLLRALDRVRSVLNELELGSFGSGSPPAPAGQAPSVDIGDPARLPARLVAATRDIKKKIDAVPNGTPGKQDLLDALDAFEKLVPDLEQLEERLEDAVETGLEDAFGSALDVTVYFDLVDYNCNTAAADNALVIGLVLDGTSLVSEDFAPDLSVPDLGPIEFDLNADAHLYAGGKLSLGFGFLFDSITPTTFVIVDPPSAGCGVNPELVETRLDLNAGFDGSLSGSVGFGELELIEGEIDLSLLADAQDTTNNMVQDVLTVVGGAVTLESTPLDQDERLMIVKEVGGSVLDHTRYSVSGTTLTFGGNSGVSNGDMVTVAYRTAAVGNLASDPTKRASLAVTLNNTPAGNTIGAVPLTSVLTNFANNIEIDALGILTGSVDATFLNNTVDNVVTLAVSVNDPLAPQFNVDDEALADMFTNIDFDLTLICEGIESLMGVIADGLQNEILTKIPIVGDGFDAAGTFVGKIEAFVGEFCPILAGANGALDAIELFLENEIYQILGPPDLDILGNRNGPASIGPEDVDVELSEEDFSIAMTLTGGDETFVNFDTNLDGLVFAVETEGGVRIGWDYTIDFGVGVSKSEGFYFVLDNTNPEFSLNVDIGLAVDNSGVDPVPTSLDLSLFNVLHLTATDMLQPDGTRGTGIGGMLSLDVCPTCTDRLNLADIGSMEFSDIFAAELSASADLALELALEINNNLPSIRTNLMGGMGVTVSGGGGSAIEVTIDEPTLAFKNIGLDLGDFIGRHIGPVLQDVNEFVEPIKPVVDFLLSEVPGLSQLSQLAGQGPVTFLDLAFMNNPEQGATTKKFIGIVKQVIDLITAVAAVSSDDNVFIPFGDLELGDTRSDAWRSGPLGSLINGQDPEDAVNGSGNSAVASVFQALQREPDEDGDEGLGIRLDILDPSNIIKLLIGQRANIITWNIPKFEIGLALDFEFHPIPIVYPFTVTIGFDFGAFADLSVGYDTRGIETGNFFDGFFFGDRADVDQGEDIPEFGLLIGARLRAELDLFIASAGIEGALVATIDANWRDVDDDGKMYLDEIAGIVQSDGIVCLFDLTGELRAIVRLVWSIFGAEDSKDILDVLIFRFQNECPRYQVAHVVTADDDGQTLPGGFTSQVGDLILHSGAFADMRQPGVTTDVAETFTIQRMAPGVVEIVGMGFTQRYPDVQRIYADLGNGADRIELIDVTDMPAILLGGAENDELIGGGLADTIDGGGGADTITSGDGDDSVAGGGGDDLIDTGDGGDTVTAGDGNDTVTTGIGNDSIDGGGGADSITSEDGNDTIVAGDGDDVVFAGIGADEIHGDGGKDTIWGDMEGDLIFGGAQNDSILGQQGNDTIDGGPGRDYIEGNEGGDVIDGNSGFDRILGHIGNDSIRGGSGHDLIESHAGNDTVVGDHDNDLIIGEEGNDRIYGGFGHDVIYSYIPGNTDDPIGQGHRVEGGPDDDFICGTTAPDDLWGGTFENNVNGGFDLYWAEWTANGYPTILAGGFTPAACEVDEEPQFDDPGFVSISGRKFEDVNADEVEQLDEPGLGGWTIIVLDDDGEEVERTTTEADGTYLFDELDPGTYTVIEELQTGFRQTVPAGDGSHTFTVDGGGAATGKNFGNYRLASVHGVKWDDRDGDGVRDDGEPGLAGWTIYVDENNNGFLDLDPDAGCIEPCTVTMEDDPETEDVDETGMYWLENIEPGESWIREVDQVDWERTFPVVNTLQRDNFEQLAVDRDWSSNVTAGQLDIDRTPAANRGFLGSFGNETVTLELEDIDPEHSQIDISFDLFILGSWNGNLGGPNGPDRFLVTADDGGGASTLVDTTFSNVGGNNQAYPNDFGMGSHPPFTGAEEINSLGYGGGSAVYRFDLSIAHSTTELALNFQGLRLPAGVTAERWGLDNVRVSFPVTGHKVSLTSGESIDAIDFGNRKTGGEIHGTKWLDIDGDGIRDPNEPGLGGVKVFLDTNNNGTLDAGEPMTTTKSQVFNDVNRDGVVGLFDVSIAQSQLGLCSPAGGRLSADLDGDGCVTRGDVRTIIGGFKSLSGLDSETEVVESAPLYGLTIDVMPATQTGEYWLTDLPAGKYAVLEVPPPGMVQTYPTDTHVIELAADQVVTGVNFGNSRGGEIHGKKCEDENTNGRCDFSTAVGGGEPGIAGVTIFADYDGDRALDPGEPSTQTMADDPATAGVNEAGMYWLAGVRPGPAQICEIVPAGYVQVFPAAGCYPIVVQPGQVLNGLDFGNRGRGEIHGTKWDDRNGNRRRDPGENGIPGVTVYIDSNNNGQLDPNEPTATTMQDVSATPADESGMYWLSNVPAGRHFVREVVPRGLTQTYPIGGAHLADVSPGGVVERRDFGNSGGGEVHGTKWNDINGDGRRTTVAGVSEPGMAGVTVFADFDGDGQLDPGEPVAVTMQDVSGTPQDETGMYWLTGLPPGTVRVCEVVPQGFRQTFPPIPPGCHTVTVVPGQPVEGVDFGNQRVGGEIHGTKWFDRNGNGQRDTGGPAGPEPGMPDVTVYIDTNGNHNFDAGEPSAVTMRDDSATPQDESGMYWLLGVPVGTHVVCEVVPQGFRQTFPQPIPPGCHTVTVGSGQVINGLDFGNTRDDGQIRGTKWNDLNGNGQRDSLPGVGLEPGRPGVVIYIDTNGNNQREASEPSTTTMADNPTTPTVNEAGMYTLLNVAPGTHRVREVLPVGSVQTFPAGNASHVVTLASGQIVADINFGNRGTAPSPEPNQPMALVAPAPGGPPLTFADCYTFNPSQPLLVPPAGVLMNDVTMGGALTAALDTPPSHGTVVVLPNGAFGYLPNATFAGSDTFTYRATDTSNMATSGPTTVLVLGAAAAGITSLKCPPSVHGNKWQDNNGNGKQEPGEPPLPGVTIYADLNQNGQLDTGEPFTMTMTDIPGTNANETGMYWLTGLPPTFVQIREVVPPGRVQTYPVDPPYHQVLLQPGQTVQNLNFGNRPLDDGEIHGKKCEDRNENGQCDFGTAFPGTEPGVAGVKIYADLNGNHQPDANEPMTFTMSDNPQTPGDETGMYWLTRVPPGTWQICEVTPPGWRQTFPQPVPPGCHTVVITAGGVVEGLNFGNVPDRERGEIHGMKWNDKEGPLGSHGATEEGVVGVDIYLDLNDNGKLDGGEPTTQTMGDIAIAPDLCDPAADPMCGMYWFVGLPAGVYNVREVVPEDCALAGLSEDGTWEVYPNTEIPPAGFVPTLQFDCVQTFPGGTGGHTINLLPGQIRENVDFGNYRPIIVPDGRDEVHGSDDNDVIKGDNELIEPRTISLGHDDELFGEDDEDDLDGQDENDTMWGGEGDDDITGGVDPLEIDWVSHAANQHMTLVNLSLDHSNGIDTLTSIERGYLEGAGSGNDLDASGFTIGPVWLVGLGGNDTLVGTDFDDTIVGGAGNDSITADAGADLITGGDGSDAMTGGTGDDFYFFAGTSVIETDTITEAAVAAGGIDRLDFSAIPASDGLTLDLDVNGGHGTRTVTIANANSIEQAYGGPGIDNIDGNGLANLLVGNAGGDNIDGEGGNDTIEGSAGTDILEGGANDDLFVFEAGWGNDTVTDSGGANDEFDFTALSANLTFNLGSVIVTQGGNTVTHLANNIEILDSGSGDDLFIFANGAQLALGMGKIHGNGGNDTLDYQAYVAGVVVNLSTSTATGTMTVDGIETVLGGSGGDDITGNNLGNLLVGNNGADTVDGAGGVDTILGGGGADSLEGGGGNDLITGGAGSDDLLGGPGDDNYFFANAIGVENDDIIELAGEGTDLIDFATLATTVAVTLNLDTGAGTNGTRSFTVSPGQVEDIIGTSANDNLTGNAANNVLEGRNGNDTMLGLGGDDQLIGGLDNDRYRFALAAGGDTAVITEHPSEGTDTLDFSAINVVDPTMDFARVDLDEGVGGVSGRVAEYGSDATRRVTASASLMINFENIIGSAGNDVITGSDAANTIGGGLGNDEIHGADGNDTLDGGSGNDSLYGERNNDRLLGGTGTNHLEGGAHDDTYVYPAAATATDTLVEEPATVIDGSSVVGGIDLINLSALTAAVDLDLGSTAAQIVNPGLSLTLTDLGPPASSQSFENVLGSLTATNDLTGNNADNSLTGGNVVDILSGGNGNDWLTGGTGNDQLSGGADDDTLIRDVADTPNVSGGAGNDTLSFVSGGTLDLQFAAFLTGIEVMDFNNQGVTFRANRTQLVAISDTDILTLNGGNLDTVNLEMTPGTWTLSVDSLQSNTYTNTAPIMAVVQDGITIGLNVAPSPPAPSPSAPAAVLVDSALSGIRQAPLAPPTPIARLAARPARMAVDALMDEGTVASELSSDRLRATRHRRVAGADANRLRDEILGTPLELL